MKRIAARPKPILVSLFRYALQDHEAMANTYPHVLADLGRTVEVHHFCGKGQTRHWLADQAGVCVHELPVRFRRDCETDKWAKTLWWYFISLRAAWWARRHKADLIYIEETLPWLPLLLAWVSGCPTAISAADMFWDVYLPDHGIAGKLKRVLLRIDVWVWQRLRGLITHTQAFKEYAVRQGLSDDRIFVVPEACEDTSFRRTDRYNARQSAGYHNNEQVILHHGLLVPNKALDRLLDFIAPLLHERPRLRIEFVGDGPMRNKLEAKAKILHIQEQVRLLGWLPTVAQLNILLNAADVSVVMRAGRVSDHFQVTANLLHSLACGSPILAARLKGVAELIHEGENGLLFNPADGDEFRRQLVRLLDDEPLRRRLADAALITARTRLNPRCITSAWVAALRTLLTDFGKATQ
ncbi:MAG: glycosyltransferase [Verrucomicrobiota bacterium]